MSEISLAVNLSRQIGFRPTTKVLQVLYKWLGVKNKIPSYQPFAHGRRGLAWTPLSMPARCKVQHGFSITHLSDRQRKSFNRVAGTSFHSLNQGQPLKFSDLDVLAEVCRSTWTDNDFYESSSSNEREIWPTRRLAVGSSSRSAETCSHLSKHSENRTCSNRLQALLANQFQADASGGWRLLIFTKQLQHTSACVQQTELSHFVPRPMKRKPDS